MLLFKFILIISFCSEGFSLPDKKTIYYKQFTLRFQLADVS